MKQQERIFRRALERADTGDTDLVFEAWVEGSGLGRNYGHGWEWEDFTEDEAVQKIEGYVAALEEPEMVSIPADELEELREKAEAYDDFSKSSSAGGKKSSANMTAEERSARAKKAVEARMKKYGQKRQKRRS